MNTGAAFYCKKDNTCVLKMVGEVRHTMSCEVNRFLGEVFAQGDCEIIVDLCGTTVIDSTMLGVVGRIAKMRGKKEPKPIILSDNPDINAVLFAMDFDSHFDIRDVGETGAIDLQQLCAAEPCSKEALTRIVYDAHCTLSEFSPNNQERFRPVLDSLQPRMESC